MPSQALRAHFAYAVAIREPLGADALAIGAHPGAQGTTLSTVGVVAAEVLQRGSRNEMMLSTQHASKWSASDRLRQAVSNKTEKEQTGRPSLQACSTLALINCRELETPRTLHTPLQGVWPSGQPHLPPEQVCPAGHLVPQVPQLLLSAERSCSHTREKESGPC